MAPRCPPDTQELFLMEFLVDKVNIPSVQAMHDDILPVKTCIEFKILNLAPIFISQDSPTGGCACLGSDAQVFRKGKSCLFALPTKVLRTPLCSFPITMCVYKKLPPTVLPDVMTIGTCQIDIHDMANCLLDIPLQCSAPNPCRTLKNNWRICTATGQCVGEVGLFLRFSRLGRKVVTQFQNPHNKKPYLFKGADNSPVFQCKKMASIVLDEEALDSCCCDKRSDCKEEKPKNCCESSDDSKKKCNTKIKSSKKRSCCPVPKIKPCKTETRCRKSASEPPAEKTRQCGCNVKEEKPTGCGN